MNACLCAFAPYEVENQHRRLRRRLQPAKSAAYPRAGLAISAFAVERPRHVRRDRHGPGQFASRTRPRPARDDLWAEARSCGYIRPWKRLKNIPPTRPSSARTRAAASPRAIVHGGGESSAPCKLNADGTVLVATGSVDVGGSRASMALMAAEDLRRRLQPSRAIVRRHRSVGYTHVTGGQPRHLSRPAPRSSTAAKKAIDELRAPRPR